MASVLDGTAVQQAVSALTRTPHQGTSPAGLPAKGRHPSALPAWVPGRSWPAFLCPVCLLSLTEYFRVSTACYCSSFALNSPPHRMGFKNRINLLPEVMGRGEVLEQLRDTGPAGPHMCCPQPTSNGASLPGAWGHCRVDVSCSKQLGRSSGQLPPALSLSLLCSYFIMKSVTWMVS